MPDNNAERDLTAIEQIVTSTVKSLQEVTGMGVILLGQESFAIVLEPGGEIKFIVPKEEPAGGEMNFGWGNFAMIRGLFAPGFEDIREALELRIQAQIDQLRTQAH